MLSSRAAILTPSPMRSPSASSTTSPRWMPRRNSMRFSGGRPALRSSIAGLHFDRAAHGVDDAAKLDDPTVAGALDDAAVIHGDGRIDQIAAERPKARQRPVLVRAGEPAIADDIRDQDRRELPGLAHGASAEASSPVAGGMGMAALPCCTGRGVEAGVQSRVSTGRSIHAPLRITRSAREK